MTGVYLYSKTVVAEARNSAIEVNWAGRRKLAMKQLLFYTRDFSSSSNATHRAEQYASVSETARVLCHRYTLIYIR